MDQETGFAIVQDTEKVTAEVTFVATQRDGSIDLVFTLNSELREGRTAVAYEDLIHNNVVVATHSDIDDEDQAIHYPQIRTVAYDSQTLDNVGTVGETESIIDTVYYRNLIVGEEYTISGVLMDFETGEELLEDGKTVTSEITFTAEQAYGTIELTFEVDSSVLAGKTIVVFEDLIHNEVVVTTHSDIEDEAQSIHYPDIHTTAADSLTYDHVGSVREEIQVIDTVYYTNLIVGKEYTISGVLMNQETGEVITQDGEEIRAEVTFTAEVADGSVDLVFTLDSSVLENQTVVAFEDLIHNGIKVRTHADLTDEEQSVHYPHITTNAVDVNTGDHTGTISDEAVIVDTVTYENLIVGEEYTINCIVVLKDEYEAESSSEAEDASDNDAAAEDAAEETAEDTADAADAADADETETDAQEEAEVVTDGAVDTGSTESAEEEAESAEEETEDTKNTNDTEAEAEDAETDDTAITATVTFVAESASGTIDLTYTLDSTLLEGKTVVVFEDLVHNDVIVSTHSDINDENQSIHYPLIHTSAADSETGDETVTMSEETRIIDTVTYENLIAGYEYTLVGTLMNKDTSEEFTVNGEVVTSSTTFIPESANGSVEVEFIFDTTECGGMSLTVFENLIHNGITVTVHEDIEDEDQSVYIPKIRTNASDALTEDHVGAKGETVTLVDVVTYENLTVGKEYTVSGILMDKETGEALLVNGKEVTASVTFTAEETSGSVELVYELDADALAGVTVVVFEDLIYKGIAVTYHADINDDDQSIYYAKIGTTATVNGAHSIVAGVITIEDVVSYENLIEGCEYTVSGVLMNKDTGSAITANGDEITATTTFIAESSSGSVTLSYTLDASKLSNTTIVVFEEMTHKGVLVAEHADLDDEAQSVFIEEPAAPNTGDATNKDVYGVLIAGAVAIIITLIIKRKKK